MDVIGLDAYDQSWATPQTPANFAWSSHHVCPRLTAAQQFASPTASRWPSRSGASPSAATATGCGDDPYYVNQMAGLDEEQLNNVTYESYFDANSGGVNSLITGGSFPNSLAAFSADLG